MGVSGAPQREGASRNKLIKPHRLLSEHFAFPLLIIGFHIAFCQAYQEIQILIFSLHLLILHYVFLGVQVNIDFFFYFS